MSDEMTPTRGRLREHVAEEIRVLLARKRISAAELARRTGIKQSTMSRRMTGETAFDMDDLEAIAEALGVEVADLMPRTAKLGQGGAPGLSDKHLYVSLSRSDEGDRDKRATPHPNVPVRSDPVRPVSAIPARTRRPQPTRPGVRPMRH